MKKLSIHNLVLVSLMVALIIVLGYVTIPMPSGLNITFSLIPLAIAAIAVGPAGGAIAGAAFGLVSFLQCFGICGYSGMGAALLNESRTFLTGLLLFVQRFFPRPPVFSFVFCFGLFAGLFPLLAAVSFFPPPLSLMRHSSPVPMRSNLLALTRACLTSS